MAQNKVLRITGYPAHDVIARRVSSLRRLASRAFFIAAFFSLAAVALAQQPKPTDLSVKATYLYNFGKFVQWPADSTPARANSFFVCVLGKDSLGPALDATLAGEQIDGHSVIARRISKPQDAADCRIVFVTASEAGDLKSILAVLSKTSALTVSDIPHFSEQGGMIEFRLDQNKVRFQINAAAADSAHLVMSSDLLKVATAVIRSSGPGGG